MPMTTNDQVACVSQADGDNQLDVTTLTERLLKTIDGLRITPEQIENALAALNSATRGEAYVMTAAKVMAQVLRDRAALPLASTPNMPANLTENRAVHVDAGALFTGNVEQRLTAMGVFKGAHGLDGLANAKEFWDRQPYGTRLYYGVGIADYLHRGVLKAAIRLLNAPSLPPICPTELEN